MILRSFFAAGAALIVALAVACGGDNEASPAATPDGDNTQPASGSITLYSGRGESLVGPLIAQFERDTGIDVDVRYAGSAEMAATIAEEGTATPADVFWSQDPGPLGFLSDRFIELPDNILSRVEDGFKAPDGKWVGVSSRVRVVVYNPERVDVADLPGSLHDLTDPRWRDRIGWAPANASFQIMVTAMRVLEGEDATRQWLDAVKDNGAQTYGNNRAVLQAVASGEVDIGVVNHYYLHATRRSTPDISAENHYLNNDEAGSLIMVSGAGILSTTDNMLAAQAFVEYLVSPTAQQFFALETGEYPVVQGVITPPGLPGLDELVGPSVDFSDLYDVEGTLNLLREVSLLE